MGNGPIPQWLLGSFVRSLTQLGVSASKTQLESAGSALIARWNEKRRHFHNVHHLVAFLQCLDDLSDSCHDSDILYVAAWYHGAVFNDTPTKVYERLGGEDEVASAQLAQEELTALGLDAQSVQRICQLILLLKQRRGCRDDIDAKVLIDAEFSVLAAPPQKYRAYRDAIRREYSLVPECTYLKARREVVCRLLRRESIFLSPLAQEWEERARQNLEAELARLESACCRHGIAPVDTWQDIEREPSSSTGAIHIKGVTRTNRFGIAAAADNVTGSCTIGTGARTDSANVAAASPASSCEGTSNTPVLGIPRLGVAKNHNLSEQPSSTSSIAQSPGAQRVRTGVRVIPKAKETPIKTEEHFDDDSSTLESAVDLVDFSFSSKPSNKS